MKNSTRIFIFLASLLSSYASFATNPSTRLQPVEAPSILLKTTPTPSLINAVPFYLEEFNGGLPTGWTVTDNSSSATNWSWTNTGIYNLGSPTGLDTLNSNGTSAANGYMKFDSDSAGFVPAGNDADLTSDVIDCSTYNVVHLRFNQLLYHFAESATVSISNDGSAWTVIYDASFGMSQGQATPNPDLVDVDITAYAALQSTVYLRFNYLGNYDYWWMIDDVQLYEPAAADAGVYAISSPTTSCTVLSNTETISVEIFNFGSDSVSGFDVSYVIDGGAPVTETIADTIAPGLAYSYSFTTTADFSVAGAYMISAYTSLTGDAENANDSSSTSIYNGSIEVSSANSYTMGFESNEDFGRWSYEDGNFDGNFWTLHPQLARTGSMCARMSAPSGAVANDWLFTPCLDLSDTVSYDLEFFYRTLSTSTQGNLEVMIGSLPASFGMTQSIQSQVFVNNLAYTRSFNNFSVPSAGVYYIGFHATNADSATSIRIDDITLAASSGVGFHNLNKGVFTVYPNPSTGVFSIIGKEASSNAEVSILNTMGQIVYKKNFTNLQKEIIDLSQEVDGQYVVRIVSEKGTTIQYISVIR